MFTVKFLIGANAYACITHEQGRTDIRLAPGKSAAVSLREYADECAARAQKEREKAGLAIRAAEYLENKES